MEIVDGLLEVAVMPEEDGNNWLQDAAAAVDYVVSNSASGEIILYAAVGQAYFFSVLAPLENVTPPDPEELLQSFPSADSGWGIDYCSGGGRPDEIFLSSPMHDPQCPTLIGGEQLVFRRNFEGVDTNEVRIELSQPLVQSLGLYWLAEEQAYCRIDDGGDIVPIIRVRELEAHTGNSYDVVVTIERTQLHRYMAITATALVTKFDFTRFEVGSFDGWHNGNRNRHLKGNLFYDVGVQGEASFANGILIVPPVFTKNDLIEMEKKTWGKGGKEYASFIACDWKNGRIAEVSCSPSLLASYFEPDLPFPFQITPVFFSPEVLSKYKADPVKYSLKHRGVQSRAGWSLETYDVNKKGQVHTYLWYLGNLPYSEQLYWKSFNERPKGPISERAHRADIRGEFTAFTDPLLDLKEQVRKLDTTEPQWWLPRGDQLTSRLHYPITTSLEEWAEAILVLDQLIVEGFSTKDFRARLKLLNPGFDKNLGSIRLLQDYLLEMDQTEEDVEKIVKPLKTLHQLRSKLKGHSTGNTRVELEKAAKKEYGSLAAHFSNLVSEIQMALYRMVELL